MRIIVCGVTNERRANSALETPGSCSRFESTEYCEVVSPFDSLGWGVALWMHADDADALCASLIAQGVRILAEPTAGNFGRQFSFADPDGYAIVVHDGK